MSPVGRKGMRDVRLLRLRGAEARNELISDRQEIAYILTFRKVAISVSFRPQVTCPLACW